MTELLPRVRADYDAATNFIAPARAIPDGDWSPGATSVPPDVLLPRLQTAAQAFDTDAVRARCGGGPSVLREGAAE